MKLVIKIVTESEINVTRTESGFIISCEKDASIQVDPDGLKKENPDRQQREPEKCDCKDTLFDEINPGAKRKPKIVEQTTSKGTTYQVWCIACGSCTKWIESRDAAVSAWNRGERMREFKSNEFIAHLRDEFQ